MDAADAMLAACVASPDDDAPRLVWADVVGGERGELVVLQCDLARGGLTPAEAAVRRRRERELLARHGVAWAGELPRHAGSWSFRRGFVEAARVPAVDAGAALSALPLLDALVIEGELTLGDVAAVAAAVRGLHLDRGQGSPLDHRRWRALAARGGFARLRAFGLTYATADDLDVLAAVLAGAGLDQLWLPKHALDEAALARLAPSLQRLRALVLSQWDRVPLAPSMFGPQLRALWLGQVTPGDLRAVAASATGPTLERLACMQGASEDPAQLAAALRALPALQVLQLGEHGCQPTVDALAAAWPARLRHLRTGVLAIPTCSRLARIEALATVTIHTDDVAMHDAMRAALGPKAEPRAPVLPRRALLHAAADALLADTTTCPARG